MKKSLVLIWSALLLLSLTSLAGATLYVETYSGSQNIREGQSYNFGFDFWYNNHDYGVGTNSNLHLTQDAVGALGAYTSGFILMDLYSTDKALEKAGVILKAYNERGCNGGTFNLGTFWFDNSGTFRLDLTSAALDAFDNWGWGNVKISAVSTNWCNYNDFTIKQVSMGVETASGPAPVPEPSTVILLGSGILALFILRKKRLNP